MALSPGVKRPGREADHSPACSACVELYLCSAYIPSWRIQGHLDLDLYPFTRYDPVADCTSSTLEEGVGRVTFADALHTHTLNTLSML